jgi:hypothetical protein
VALNSLGATQLLGTVDAQPYMPFAHIASTLPPQVISSFIIIIITTAILKKKKKKNYECLQSRLKPRRTVAARVASTARSNAIVDALRRRSAARCQRARGRTHLPPLCRLRLAAHSPQAVAQRARPILPAVFCRVSDADARQYCAGIVAGSSKKECCNCV